MRKIILLALIVLPLGCVRGNKSAEMSVADRAVAVFNDPSAGKVLVASHRADWRNYPENSIPAIESVIRMGVDIVELDVAMTSDSVLVLSHDGTVDRMTNGTGPIRAYTLDSIRTLRLKVPGGEFSDSIGIPTLEEALTVCKDRIMVNVDHGWDYFDEVYEVASRVGCLGQIIFKSSGDRQATAEAMRKCASAGIIYMPIVTIAKDGTSTSIDSYLDGGEMPVMFEVCFSKDSPEAEAKIKALQAAGSKVWVNSIWGSLCGDNDDERAFQGPEEADTFYGRLLDMGFKVFQSDRPEYLLNYLKEKGLRD